ncbi:MerR family transcriptional regulator [Pseudarthrobacter sp. J75]|uniref:MerR family transcriptional regulator n=1 Tax=unclassified Pseudarthrobacter TaxID=2647000 RepID=UPI002E80AC5A|nr:MULTISPECIES: MerR family transcriptional regulator [unclassified Pseudarthrobacter]MEE2522255.1 MerR family transcriptional regulator [Pseudarthrobacter sp. J47]MEE2528099.1 MerR family transcriptional regulator [Pseudarthrobacter sp. J75]
MDWSIQEIARLTGTTSRTLRHYDDVGLLKPSRVGHNGYRYYNQDALVQLQRILLLRGLGLGLPVIAGVLRNETDAAKALAGHLDWLRSEQERLGQQIASVQQTLKAVKGGGNIMAEDMFNGFDHTQYKDEVEQRWGKDAYASSDKWWRNMSAAEQAEWKDRAAQLGSDWIAAAESGAEPGSEAAQALAKRHVEWLTGIPGTPAFAGAGGDTKAYVTGLGEMYVADPRFTANYGGQQGAEIVRDALRIYADANL